MTNIFMEKVLNIISHQENAKQNHNEGIISSSNGYYVKCKKEQEKAEILVGMQMSAAILENSAKVPPKTKNRSTV